MDLNKLVISENNREVIIIGDSCYCGLYILKNIYNYICSYNIIFIADYKYNPFGLRNKSQVNELVKSWEIPFSKYNVLKTIIACNTASISLDLFDKNRYITMIDALINFIKANNIKNKSITLFATKFTIESKLYEEIMYKAGARKINCIIGTYTESLINNENNYNDITAIKAEQELKEIKETGNDFLLLACTCFGAIRNLMVDSFGEIHNLNDYVEIRSLINDTEYKIPPQFICTDFKKKQFMQDKINQIFDENYEVFHYDWPRNI